MYHERTSGTARGLANAYEQAGNPHEAIHVLRTWFGRRAEFAVDRRNGRPNGHHWIGAQADLARLYRLTSRVREAQTIESELRRLLAVADADHPVLLQLGR
jgi:hypothetical protein